MQRQLPQVFALKRRGDNAKQRSGAIGDEYLAHQPPIPRLGVAPGLSSAHRPEIPMASESYETGSLRPNIRPCRRSAGLIPNAQGLAKTRPGSRSGFGRPRFSSSASIIPAARKPRLFTDPLYRGRSAEWLAGQMTPAGPGPSTVYLRLPPSAACFSAFSATSASGVGSLA